MPPLYVWRDQNSGKQVDILRSFDEFRDPPTQKEAIEEGLTASEAEVANWEKLLGQGVQMVRGDGWNGRKGSW